VLWTWQILDILLSAVDHDRQLFAIDDFLKHPEVKNGMEQVGMLFDILCSNLRHCSAPIQNDVVSTKKPLNAKEDSGGGRTSYQSR